MASHGFVVRALGCAGALAAVLCSAGCSTLAFSKPHESFTQEDAEFFRTSQGMRKENPVRNAGNDPDSFLKMARFYADAGKLPLAERMYEKAIAAEPHATAGYVGLVKLHFAAGKLDAAAVVLERAKKACKQPAPLWNELAVLRAKQGDLESAADAAEKALQLAPDVELYRTNLGNLLAASKQYDRAYEIFAQADGPAEARVRLGKMALAAKDSKAAERQLRLAIGLEANHPEARSLYAQLGGQEGRGWAPAAKRAPAVEASAPEIVQASATAPQEPEAGWRNRGRPSDADRPAAKKLPPARRQVTVIEDEP